MKLLLYCTKAKPQLSKVSREYTLIKTKDNQNIFEALNGKIVAECDFEVEEITPSTWSAETECRILKGSCLKEHQLFDYIIKGDENESQNPFYAIHIKNLKIFDKPKELDDYYYSRKGKFRTLGKAPQNMMYAYDNEEKKILISIQPQWLVRILNHEKTIEVRKKVLKEMLG